MLAESSDNFGFLFFLLLMMGLIGVGVWTYDLVRLVGRSTLALDRTAWTWKGIRPMNRGSFFDLSGISTIALSHVFYRQLRGKGHSQLRKMASSSWSLRNISPTVLTAIRDKVRVR